MQDPGPSGNFWEGDLFEHAGRFELQGPVGGVAAGDAEGACAGFGVGAVACEANCCTRLRLLVRLFVK